MLALFYWCEETLTRASKDGTACVEGTVGMSQGLRYAFWQRPEASLSLGEGLLSKEGSQEGCGQVCVQGHCLAFVALFCLSLTWLLGTPTIPLPSINGDLKYMKLCMCHVSKLKKKCRNA